MVASLALVSCGTVKTSTATLEATPQAAPETTVAVATTSPAPAATLVVKSPVVPDDPEPVVAPAAPKAESVKKTPAIVTAEVAQPPVAAPVVAEEPASPESKPVPAPAPVSKPVPEKPAAEAAPAPVKVAEVPAAKPAAEKPVAPVSAPAEPAPAAEAPPTSITPPAATPETAPATTPAAAKDDAADKAKPPSSIFANPSSWLKDPKALLQASIGGFPLWLVVLLVLLAFISLVVGFRGKKSPPPATAEIGGGS